MKHPSSLPTPTRCTRATANRIWRSGLLGIFLIVLSTTPVACTSAAVNPTPTSRNSPNRTAFPTASTAPTIVAGTVFDARSGQVGSGHELGGATVTLLPLGISKQSDAKGEFAFSLDLRPGCIKIDVEASASGLGPWREDGFPVVSGGDMNITIALDSAAHRETYRAGGALATLMSQCDYVSPIPSPR